MWKNVEETEKWSKAVGQTTADVQDLEKLQVEMYTTDPTETVKDRSHEAQCWGNCHHERGYNSQALNQEVQRHVQSEKERAKQLPCN